VHPVAGSKLIIDRFHKDPARSQKVIGVLGWRDAAANSTGG
jgi:hypothetical protein